MPASVSALSGLVALVLLAGAKADALPVAPPVAPPVAQPAPAAWAPARPSSDAGVHPDALSDRDPIGVWPLRPDPRVVHGFDPPATAWGAGHRGVDLLARPGQVVRAALPGTVVFAATLAGRGVVVVSHGATRTTYEPVEATVEPGTVVAAGERLGTVQAAPSHCAPQTCLHWGWVAGETYLDPLRLVGLGPVRLLPYLSGGAVARGTVVSPPVPVWW